jgi:hypothetical protein
MDPDSVVGFYPLSHEKCGQPVALFVKLGIGETALVVYHG